jgi:hypothetical protein
MDEERCVPRKLRIAEWGATARSEHAHAAACEGRTAQILRGSERLQKKFFWGGKSGDF